MSGEGFTWTTQDRDKDIKAARSDWDAACSGIELARADPSQLQLIVLDELSVALHYGKLPMPATLALRRRMSEEFAKRKTLPL